MDNLIDPKTKGTYAHHGTHSRLVPRQQLHPTSIPPSSSTTFEMEPSFSTAFDISTSFFNTSFDIPTSFSTPFDIPTSLSHTVPTFRRRFQHHSTFHHHFLSSVQLAIIVFNSHSTYLVVVFSSTQHAIVVFSSAQHAVVILHLCSTCRRHLHLRYNMPSSSSPSFKRKLSSLERIYMYPPNPLLQAKRKKSTKPDKAPRI